MKAIDYVKGNNVPPNVAAKILANRWCENKSRYIDLWDCSWFGKDFMLSFLKIIKQNNCLQDAFDIEWHLPCETNNDTIKIQTEVWITNFIFSSTY